MNEKLQELAHRAGYNDRGSNHTAYMQFDHEKFAQLILAECVIVCKNSVGNSDYNTGRMHCAADIQQHFGV
jgi:hypothetical protein